MQVSDLVVSYYPLSADQISDIESSLEKPVENFVLSALNARQPREIIGQLRTVRADTVYIPVLSPDWEPFLPLLRILCRLIRARRVMLIRPGLGLERDTLAAALLSLSGVVVLTLVSLFGLIWHRRTLERLLATPRQPCEIQCAAKDVLYLKSNLWTGVLAGGAVAHTLGVVGSLARRGLRITYVSPGEAPELADMRGVHAMRVPLPMGYIYPRELNTYRYNSRLRQWLGKLRSRPVAFVYHRLSLGSYVAVLMARRLEVPLVVEYNGSEGWINKHWGSPLKFPRLADLAENVCLRHAHLVVTISEPLKRELLARGVEPERIVLHPNGFDPDVFNPERFPAEDKARLRQEMGIPADALVATFVGTFGQWHGAQVLAEALIHLHREHGGWLAASRLHMLFVGDGVNRAHIEAMLGQFGPPGRHTFTGLVPAWKAPPLLAISDLFISPHVPNPDGSDFFGSPTKLFEYMGMGRPVLASALGQIAEVMEGARTVGGMPREDAPAPAQECGILLTPASVSELADALVYAAEHPQWCRTAGGNARRRALDRFTWARHVDAVLAGLAAVVPEAPSGRAIAPVRVLINAVHAKSGGGVTYLRNLLPLLADDPRLTVDVVVQSDQEAMFRPLVGDMKLWVLPAASRLGTVLVQEQLGVPALARRRGIEVVFSPANYGPLFGCRSVILLRNAFEVGQLEQRLSKRAYWLAVRLLTFASFLACRRAIAVSRFAQDSFLRSFGRDADPRLGVVHHGVARLFSPPVEDRRDRWTILTVSDIYLQKNLETLLEAMAVLRRSYPQVRLRVVGRRLDDHYYDRLMELCRRLELGDAVEFLGGLPPDGVAAEYRMARVFVFPSLVETFGNPLVEAMASGLPVVCSNAAALPEVVGGAALMARPRDTVDMAAQIARLLEDDELWHSLSQNGLRRAACFSWEMAAERTANVLLEAASD